MISVYSSDSGACTDFLAFCGDSVGKISSTLILSLNRPPVGRRFAVPDPKNDQQSNPLQDDLAASIVDAWAELDKKAEAENPDEFRKAREMLAEWGNKLESLLKGKKP